MMIGGKIAELSAYDDIQLKEYNHCLAKIICNPPQPDYFQTCKFCPGILGLKEHLHALMDNNMIDTVQYKQWVSTDRSTLETITKPADEFVESFCEQLKTLLTRSFVAKQQSSFKLEVKSTLLSGVFQVIADFSENYFLYSRMKHRGFTGTIHKQLSIPLLCIIQNQENCVSKVMLLYLIVFIMIQLLFIYFKVPL